ncbi:MAG: hypothetical protein AAGE93_11575 [Bacteroidota bacterium]
MSLFRSAYIARTFIAIAAVIFLAACSEDDNNGESPTPEETIKTSGFLITGTTSSNNALVRYFEDIPTGTVDLSAGTDFIQFLPTSIYDHYIYLARPDDLPGFSKMAVNSNGELEEVGTIPTVDEGSFRIGIRDANTGVYQDRNTPNIITVFDPTTLETTATIDMTEGLEPTGSESRYQRFIFRDDDIFSPIRPNDNSEGLYSGFYLHQANLATNNYVGSTGVDAPLSGGVLTVNNFGQEQVDTNGDLYVQDGGAVGTGTFARIYKIPAGSDEIDPNYVFEPVRVIAPSNIFYPIITGFKLVAPGKAIARVNTNVPQEVIDLISSFPGSTFEEKVAAFLADDDAIQQALAALFTAETAAWCELDLVAQTVTIIEGAPVLGANAGGLNTFKHNGEVYFPIATQTEQAFYKYTPGTPTATKAFDVTGADLSNGYNIANNN